MTTLKINNTNVKHFGFSLPTTHHPHRTNLFGFSRIHLLILKMAQSTRRLRLVHAGESFCDTMVSANTALSDGRIGDAIRHYTEVLYKQSPGHVCAFLNRSLAYLEDGDCELAVMDAYRAGLAASELRKSSPVADKRLNNVAKYIRAERLHVDANDEWTRPRQRNIGTGWALSPLASIVINATPEVAPNTAVVPPFGTSRMSLAKALEIRASYRLCGALLMVGDGARMDALGMIDDAKLNMKMALWESRWFDTLGNEIMEEVVSEVDPYKPEDLEFLGHDTPEKRKERMMNLKENMKATTSHVSYGEYPWDPFEPKLRESDWRKQAQVWLEKCSDSCSASVVLPIEREDPMAGDPKPYIELGANRDIYAGDLILSERTISNVTTSIPEQVEAKRGAGILDHYYCNSCASLLVVPQECSNQFQTHVEPENPTSLTLSSRNSSNTTQSTISTGASFTSYSGQPSDTQSAPSSLATSSSTQDFMFCRPSHMVPTCSAACRELSEEFDNGICQTKIEQKLRQSHFNDPKPRSITDCKTQCLRDLIFLRHITMAINLGENPLRTNDLMFATSGPNNRDAENGPVEPWSFMSHVIRPLRYLQHIFENTGFDQFLKLSQLDGWIINTLLFKINSAMRISKGPRYVKCFRADGMLDSAFGPWGERWDELTKVPKEQEDKSIWIASIDSLFNMIRIADPERRETPNVAVVHKDGVNVYAVKTHDGKGPAIRAGEPLLRARNGVEGLALEEALYAYMREGPAESMDESDGDGDGEESNSEHTGDSIEESNTGEEEEDVDVDETSGDDGEEAHSGDTSEFLEEFSADEEEELDADADADDRDELGEEGMVIDDGDALPTR